VIEFYGQLHDPERSRAQALQHAQVKLLSTRHYRHPGYWAPFLLISSWL
jgi:CHAT domain-containing protein